MLVLLNKVKSRSMHDLLTFNLVVYMSRRSKHICEIILLIKEPEPETGRGLL